MFKTMGIAMVFVVIVGLAGCGVSRDDYDMTKQQLKEALADREQSLEDLKRANASMEELKAVVEDYRGENKRYKVRILELEQVVAQNADELKKAAEPRIDLALTKQLEAAGKKMSALSSKITGLASENKSLQGLNSKLKGSLSKMESQISEYRNKLEKMIQIPASKDIKKNVPEGMDLEKSLPEGFGKDLF